MRKIIIIDDEPVIRAGLKALIDSTGSFRVTAECRNGKEGLEEIIRSSPDIVIMDIKMPVMDGMELLEILSHSEHKPKMIILSGYGEFDYAQAAIRYGAIDYMLKPVDHEILLNKLEILAGSLDKEDKEKEERDIRDSLALISGNGFRIPEILQVKGNACYFTVVIDSDDFGSGNHQGRKSSDDDKLLVSVLVREKLTENGFTNHTVFEYLHRITVLVAGSEDNAKDISRTQKNLKNVFFRIVNTVSSETSAIFYAGISTPVTEISLIRSKYNEALAISRIYVSRYGKPQVFTSDEHDSSRKAAPVFVDEVLQASSSILTLESMKVKEIISYVTGSLNDPDLSSESIYETCIRFAADMISSAGVSECGDYLGLLKKIEDSRSLPEIGYHLTEHAIKCIDRFREKNKEKYGHIISEVMIFINKNLGEKNLSTGMISSNFHLDPSYFCRLFKEKTDLTFGQYLTSRRVDEARILLKNSSLKISDISSRTGFQNVKYFHKIFKQITGHTPKEFREK